MKSNLKSVFKVSVVFFLYSCAGAPPFQEKLTHEVGYEVFDIRKPDAFTIRATLPTSSEGRYAGQYLSRAAMEICLKAGYGFVDISESRSIQSPSSMIVVELDSYCFSEEKRRALGLLFKLADSNPFGAKIQVESVENKPDAAAKKDDYVLAVNNVPVDSIQQIKKLVFFKNQVKAIRIKIVRAGSPLTIEEPITIMVQGHLNSKDLQELREWVK